MDERLKAIIHQVAAERTAEVIEMEVMPDHGHLLVEVDPQYGIHRFVKQVKGGSSRLLRQECVYGLAAPRFSSGFAAELPMELGLVESGR